MENDLWKLPLTDDVEKAANHTAAYNKICQSQVDKRAAFFF